MHLLSGTSFTSTVRFGVRPPRRKEYRSPAASENPSPFEIKLRYVPLMLMLYLVIRHPVLTLGGGALIAGSTLFGAGILVGTQLCDCPKKQAQQSEAKHVFQMPLEDAKFEPNPSNVTELHEEAQSELEER